jgi:hypothetical protein
MVLLIDFERCLKLAEGLLLLLGSRSGNSKKIELDSLGERAALSNNDIVTDVDCGDEVLVWGSCLFLLPPRLTSEGGADVHWQLGMSSLVSVVLWHIVQVFPSNDDSSAHLSRDDLSSQDTSSNWNETSPWALFVNVLAVNGSSRRLEAQADLLVPSLCAGRLASDLWVEEDGLLLKSSLALNSQLYTGGSHIAAGRKQTKVSTLAFCRYLSFCCRLSSLSGTKSLPSNSTTPLPFFFLPSILTSWPKLLAIRGKRERESESANDDWSQGLKLLAWLGLSSKSRYH